jgi:hypothetical protein
LSLKKLVVFSYKCQQINSFRNKNFVSNFSRKENCRKKENIL